MVTANWIDREIARNFERASEVGRRAAAIEPRARKARYDAKNDRVVVELTNGCIFAFPPRLAQGLRAARKSDLAAVEVTPAGALSALRTMRAILPQGCQERAGK